MASALIVFAKVPAPGAVKTRLTPVLTPSEAAQMYRAFLLDALHQYTALDVDVRLYLKPPLPPNPQTALSFSAQPDLGKEDAGANDGPEQQVPEGVDVIAQRGDGLGEKMGQAFQETLASGYERVCIVGTDHPTLPTGFIRQAFASLTDASATCIGPSVDGGFYLLGMNRYVPDVFQDMTYSHPNVFRQTLTRIGQTQSRLTVLPEWYDVDTPSMLARMLADLEEGNVRAPNTRRVVEALDLGRLRVGVDPE